MTNRLVAAGSLAAAVALVLAGPASANDRTLSTALTRWSRTIANDARGIGLSAASRHPRRMTRRARLFRADALRAQRAVGGIRPSTAHGRRAKRLALTAFRDYAIVGREWILAGQARLAGRRLVAVRHARIAATYALRGSRLLISAGKLVR